MRVLPARGVRPAQVHLKFQSAREFLAVGALEKVEEGRLICWTGVRRLRRRTGGGGGSRRM